MAAGASRREAAPKIARACTRLVHTIAALEEGERPALRRPRPQELAVRKAALDEREQRILSAEASLKSASADHERVGRAGPFLTTNLLFLLLTFLTNFSY